MPDLTVSLSIRLTPDPSAPFSAVISEFFVARSGSSPVRVKSLPFRRIDSGARFMPGTDRLGAVTLMLGALMFTLGLSAPQPSHPNSSGISSRPNSQPNPGERRYQRDSVRHSVAVVLTRTSSEPVIGFLLRRLPAPQLPERAKHTTRAMPGRQGAGQATPSRSITKISVLPDNRWPDPAGP